MEISVTVSRMANQWRERVAGTDRETSGSPVVSRSKIMPQIAKLASRITTWNIDAS